MTEPIDETTLRSFHKNCLDCDEVHPRLWVGGSLFRNQVDGRDVLRHGFTHVAFCADEHQPSARDFAGLVTIHCPLFDSDTVLGSASLSMTMLAARAVAEAHRAGGNVLVMCQAGINRSAMVAALAMQMLGMEPNESVERLRRRRHPHCLANLCFERIVRRQNKAMDFYFSNKEDD